MVDNVRDGHALDISVSLPDLCDGASVSLVLQEQEDKSLIGIAALAPVAIGSLESIARSPRVRQLWALLAIFVMIMLFGVLTAFSSGSIVAVETTTLDTLFQSSLLSQDPQRRVLETVTCAVDHCKTNFSGCACTPIPEDKPKWLVGIEWTAIVFLVCMSALFSGLTLGLMSLDLIGLDIVIGGDPDSDEARYARAIKPIRARGNLLLCTLLLGNVSVNSLLSILLADYTSGLIGFVMSTFVIVIFGEIFPQATCSRHALYMGHKAVYIVRFFMVILFPVAWPIACMLDCVFKEEIGNVYSTGELKKLVEIHKIHKTVDEDQAKMMDGALAYRDKMVRDVMTPKKEMFMLRVHDTLNFETMSKIFQAGCSRIPVYSDGAERNDVVGLLLTKDLILIDPEDNTTVSSVVQFFGRQVFYLWPDTKLPDALRLFRSGHTHMAVVRSVNNEVEDRDPFYEIVGLITLEDIIEEILQEEILDETDTPEEAAAAAAVNGNDQLGGDGENGHKNAVLQKTLENNENFIGGLAVGKSLTLDRTTFDFALLRLLDTKSHANELSESEIAAIVAHLSTNLIFFKGALEHDKITNEQVRALVTHTAVLQLKPGEVLYKKSRLLDHCTLVLSGSLEIVSGAEGFRSTMGAWSFVGQSSLNLEVAPGSTLCDFTATVKSEEGLRCLRINRNMFEAMLSGETPSSTLQLGGLPPPTTTVSAKPSFGALEMRNPPDDKFPL